VKKKANIQLELEITAIWQHYDGQRFDQLLPSTTTTTKTTESKLNQKKIESIGNAKYTVASDSEVDVYTEEDVDLNLSEIVSDEDEEDYKSAFSTASNPFEKQDEEDALEEKQSSGASSFGSMLSSLSGASVGKTEDPPRPAREPPKKLEAKEEKKSEDTNPFEKKSVAEKKEETNPFEKKETTPIEKNDVKKEESNPFEKRDAKKEDSNPFAKKEEPKKVDAVVRKDESKQTTSSATTCHDCKRENKVGWKFCDTCGARSKVAEETKSLEVKKETTKPADVKKDVVEVKKEAVSKSVDVKKDIPKPVEAKKGNESVVAVASAFPEVVERVVSGNVDELRSMIDLQRREISTLKENERKFSNAVTAAERKALAAESVLQGKERELKRLVVQRSAAAGGSSDDMTELLKQVSELEIELKNERRKREFGTMMENLVFLCSFSFTKENESVAALKMFDEFIRLSLFDDSMASQNVLMMDHLFNTIVLLCQNPKVPMEVTQYWIVSSVHLLKLLKGKIVLFHLVVLVLLNVFFLQINKQKME
jgi:hypothetical protein